MPKKKIIDLNDEVRKKPHKIQKAVKKKRILSDAPSDHYFVLCNGQTIKNVRELADVLESVDDGTFYHHVTQDRNDFATWVKDIFEEEPLANELGAAKDRVSLRMIIYKYLLSNI